jgi:glycosyltransferase involved in cell wall biosynthesis
MRILYSFPHAIGAPGIGTTAIQQVKGLIGRGQDVTVMAASIHPNANALPHLAKTMVFAGVRVPHRVLGIDRTMALHDARVAAHLRRNPDAYEVVHSWPGATLRTSKIASEIGIPCLREVPNTHTANAMDVVGALCRELDVELPKGHSHQLDVDKIRREEREYRQATFLLVPSDYVRSTFISRGFSAEKLLRHQYGFDSEAFTPPSKPRRGRLHAIFLGAVDPRKGMHIALEAWKRAGADRDCQLSIYGGVVDGYEAVLSRFLPMSKVQFEGFTEDAAAVLRGADILLLPSFEEGSALVTYEAQGSGVVPLVSDATGALCEHGVSGLVHPAGDVQTLSEHIAQVRGDRRFLEKLRGGVLRNRASLTWEAAAERLEQCYETARTATMAGRTRAA